MKIALIIAVFVATGFFLPAVASAEPNATFKLDISPRECTVDVLNSGIADSTEIQPEECHPAQQEIYVDSDGGGQPIEHSSANYARDTALGQDTRPGDQKIFENTVFEPLARWTGIGNKDASSARPIFAITSFVGATVVGIDAVFFGLQFTAATLGGTKRLIGGLLGRGGFGG